MYTEVVISHYDRDLSWVRGFDPDVKVSIVTKSEAQDISPLLDLGHSVLRVKNIGRDVHTFFKSISILRKCPKPTPDYIIFFLQDYPFDHFENCVDTVNNLVLDRANVSIGGFFAFHYNTIGTMWKLPTAEHFIGEVLKCSSNGMPQDHNSEINVDRYWRLLFTGDPPSHYEFNPGGHFAITHEHIFIRPRAFYLKIIELLETEKVAPWIIERLELYIFDERYEIHDHYRPNW